MMPLHYSLNNERVGWQCEELTVDQLAKMFHADDEGPLADEMNWLFLSTSGVHGSYRTLKDVSGKIAAGETVEVTFLVLQPRKVAVRYGNVLVRSEAEAHILRRLVDTTVHAIKLSQSGNWLADCNCEECLEFWRDRHCEGDG
jgi:hypothetical protein